MKISIENISLTVHEDRKRQPEWPYAMLAVSVLLERYYTF